MTSAEHEGESKTDPVELSGKPDKTRALGAVNLGAVKKWLGLAAAVIALTTAVLGLLHGQAARRARAAAVSEQLAAGRREASAGDYAHAWDSFQKAAQAAAQVGVFSRLFFGSLGPQQAQAHAALEDLAERWVEGVPKTREEGLLAADNAIKTLADEVDAAQGARKADLLAHIGYAYFERTRLEGEEAGTQPAAFYRAALAADPRNPYAHAFWGQLIIISHGWMAQAQEHFAAALAAHREHARVRQLELSALVNIGSGEMGDLWWQLVNEMRKAGEPLDANVTDAMMTRYSWACGNERDRQRLYAAVPPADHVALARYVLQSGDAGGNTLPVKVMLAYSLEAAGSQGEALAAWQDVQRAAQGYGTSVYNTLIQEALKRLAGPTPMLRSQGPR